MGEDEFISALLKYMSKDMQRSEVDAALAVQENLGERGNWAFLVKGQLTTFTIDPDWKPI